MKNETKSRTRGANFLIPRLVEAGLAGDRQKLELLSLSAVRSLRADAPEVATELADVLGRYSVNKDAVRWSASEPPPADSDGGLSLLRIENTADAAKPLLERITKDRIDRFLAERLQSSRLISEGLAPPRTLLLKGAPGTGKTMLAQWLSRQLGMSLVVLDLATSISSYLGKTGANLRRSLDYARANPCVLLLDEFDAIGKRRDDSSEVGELKRIVNVLLKELEDWPFQSVLVAATNHPELLDPAINRRFDVVLEIPLPGVDERQAILTQACGRFAKELPNHLLHALATLTDGRNGSELVTLSSAAVRRRIVEETPLANSLIEFAVQHISTSVEKKHLANLIRVLHEAADLSVREIAELVGKSSTTVHYHINKRAK